MTTALTTRHEELLDELVALFLAEGFRAFTLGEVAARLRCSKSTLYALGHSKEQVTLNALKRYFRTTTDQVERRTARAGDPAARIIAYLDAVAEALRPASTQFHADLEAHPGARALYELNTAAAAQRMRELIAEGSQAGVFREVHAQFVGDVVAATMARIQSGELTRSTGLRDSEAYTELAALVLSGIRSRSAQPAE